MRSIKTSIREEMAKKLLYTFSDIHIEERENILRILRILRTWDYFLRYIPRPRRAERLAAQDAADALSSCYCCAIVSLGLRRCDALQPSAVV